MADLIVLTVVLIILGLAISYLVKEKKQGSKCIGCPYAKSCAKKRKNIDNDRRLYFVK